MISHERYIKYKFHLLRLTPEQEIELKEYEVEKERSSRLGAFGDLLFVLIVLAWVMMIPFLYVAKTVQGGHKSAVYDLKSDLGSIMRAYTRTI